MAILMTSVPLWFFPASMTDADRRESVTSDENRDVIGSTWRQITGETDNRCNDWLKDEQFKNNI